jgi:phospholipid-binding lipoprotein MlaA
MPVKKLTKASQTVFRLFALLGLQLCLIGPVYAQDDDDDFFEFDEGPQIADPLESLNRATFALNDSLYRGVLKPVAVAFRVVPEPARISLSNFFSNLGTPISAINALLQLDLPNAGTEASRFAINSTLGILGLFDPAGSMGIEQDNEDLGQTLGRYGVGHGFYVVIPFLGFSSLRDGLGSLGNTAINPVLDPLSTGEIIALNLAQAETTLSLDPDTYEALYQSAIDPYIFFRTSYIQNRAGRVEE